MNDVKKVDPGKPVHIKVKLTFLSPYLFNYSTIKPLYFKTKDGTIIDERKGERL